MASDSELDYQDENGDWWIMAACGHHVGGSSNPGDKIALCPNCNFMASLGKHIEVKHPERLPDDLEILDDKR